MLNGRVIVGYFVTETKQQMKIKALHDVIFQFREEEDK